MKPHHFLNAVDHDRIVAAIAAAEERTSGEIRVFITRRKTSNALHAASLCFLKLKMHETPLRNAVLIFIAPVSHQFAVVGDTAVHAKCGNNFWREVVEGMEPGPEAWGLYRSAPAWRRTGRLIAGRALSA